LASIQITQPQATQTLGLAYRLNQANHEINNMYISKTIMKLTRDEQIFLSRLKTLHVYKPYDEQ